MGVVDFSRPRGHIREMKHASFLLFFALAACGGEPIVTENVTGGPPSARTDLAPIAPDAVPVRIGELGPNFDACSAAGTSRRIEAGEGLQVRAAPFETAEVSGSIPAASRFFVCTRSHDQRWFGVVYEDGGTLSPACGVSRPINARRSYDGPCRSGWVSSAFVKVIAG
jgi:hypothetical protein